ncbi:MAG: hypothetical protein MR295_01635 [Ruminococcus bromii]|nr:hypothetical protein [Ruminococcus bromii]
MFKQPKGLVVCEEQAASPYFDADGTPMLHCRIYSLAGASWYEYLIPLFP